MVKVHRNITEVVVLLSVLINLVNVECSAEIWQNTETQKNHGRARTKNTGNGGNHGPKSKENSTLHRIIERYMTRIAIPLECQDEVGYGNSTPGELEVDWIGGTLSWNANGEDFPLLRDEFNECLREEERDDLWVCNPDGGLTEDEARDLDSKVNSMLKSADCACPDEMCSNEQPPNGRYGLAIAVVNSVEGPLILKKENMLALACSLAWQRWRNQSIYSCNDGMVTVLATDFNEIATYAMPVASRSMPDQCIRTIEVELFDDLQSGNWHSALSDMVEYYKYALQGWPCGELPGLPDLAIVVIFLSVLIAFAALLGFLLCCIGYCQNWEWVEATCIGSCIAHVLGSVQVCVNLVLFGFCRSGCRAIGCDRCNKLCHPIDCVGEEVSEDDKDTPYGIDGPAVETPRIERQSSDYSEYSTYSTENET